MNSNISTSNFTKFYHSYKNVFTQNGKYLSNIKFDMNISGIWTIISFDIYDKYSIYDMYVYLNFGS